MPKKTRRKTRTAEQRFWRLVNKTKSCWEWIGSLSTGYGKFRVNYQSVYAHRYVIELEGSDVPSGLLVLHKCDNRKCVNPDHLFFGTHQDNTDDMIQKGRAWFNGGEALCH